MIVTEVTNTPINFYLSYKTESDEKLAAANNSMIAEIRGRMNRRVDPLKKLKDQDEIDAIQKISDALPKVMNAQLPTVIFGCMCEKLENARKLYLELCDKCKTDVGYGAEMLSYRLEDMMKSSIYYRIMLSVKQAIEYHKALLPDVPFIIILAKIEKAYKKEFTGKVFSLASHIGNKSTNQANIILKDMELQVNAELVEEGIFYYQSALCALNEYVKLGLLEDVTTEQYQTMVTEAARKQEDAKKS